MQYYYISYEETRQFCIQVFQAYGFSEKEFERRSQVMAEGIPVNEKTYGEMQMIEEYTGMQRYLPERSM